MMPVIVQHEHVDMVMMQWWLIPHQVHNMGQHQPGKVTSGIFSSVSKHRCVNP